MAEQMREQFWDEANGNDEGDEMEQRKKQNACVFECE